MLTSSLAITGREKNLHGWNDGVVAFYLEKPKQVRLLGYNDTRKTVTGEMRREELERKSREVDWRSCNVL